MLASVSLYSQLARADVPSCVDFLELLDNKPSNLEYDSCKPSKESQLRVLNANYSVKGKFASKLEEELQGKFKMPELKFKCCGWTTGYSYGSAVYKNYNIAVRMHSDETLIQNREQWSNISKFYVIVTLYLDEP